ncbi:MAG: lysophospholipid acyltransferase family protein [Proteobacteria bacterium]|nr:lysophospholipid acyltransferase family protein [Pseudomonadota bacterium]MBU1581711.1 lysophospholipid acyltransferase family protein [Pseudomonadota bacterium]MBU2455945.1 lysophospholipid acyltransferase family protein [Pseudomonadota bacterium]MBU2631372.1 lysophospholipid acyltransferase family protein [Pseudomonadota bacterium]
MPNNDNIRWNSKSIGSKFGHNFFYFMVKLGGRRLAYFFLYFIVAYYCLFFPSIWKKTDPYLLKRFPGSGIFKRICNRYLLILHLGKALIDRAILGISGKESIRISFSNPTDLERIKSLNSGFILLMSHTGCWQVVMSALSELKKPVNLLMLRNDQDIDKHYFEHGNAKNIFKIIDPEQFLGGTIEMINVLKNDEILCIMGDRVFKNKELSVKVDFLGKDALFPFSAYKIASIAQKPVVILYSHKSGPDSYQLSISNIIHLPAKLGKKKEVYMPFVKKFVTSLEIFIQEYPYQFFNFYDMWEADQKE